MKNCLSIFQAACILKRCLFAVVLVICSHLSLGATDDLMKAENYYPGGKYSVFGGEFARGSVTGVINTIRKQETSHQAGPIVLKKATYDGGLYYEQHFSGHPWWEHGSAYHSRPLDINPFFGGIDLGSLSTTKAHIEGVLDHPDNGYDGEQGGGHAEPIGGRDYFYYGVTGEVYSTSIQPLNIPKKVNDIVNRINDAYNSGAYADGENRQPEDNSADNDRRRDLHSDGQPENGQPENADNGSWEEAEVKPPVDVATAEAAVGGGGWLSDFLTSLAKKRNPYKSSIDQLEDSADYNPVAKDLMDDIGRFGDDAGKLGNKAGDTAGAGNSSHIWSKGPEPTPSANAYRHWKDHGSDFPQYRNAKEYAEGANDFVRNPPDGTLSKVRTDRSPGDTVYYHPGTNTFAVKSKDGTVKTMFKPQDGKDYYDRQK